MVNTITRKLFYVASLTLCGLACISIAQAESGHPYAIIFGADVDDAGALSTQAALSFGISEQTWITGTIGNSRSPDDQTGLDIFTSSIGADHLFKSGVGISGDIDYWGDSDELTRTGVRLQAYYRSGDWRFGGSATTRNYDAKIVLPLIMDTREVGFDSEGYGLFLRYSGDNWGFSTRGTTYDYSINPRVLNTAFAIERLGLSAITLADSLLDQRVSVSLERKFKKSRLLEFSYSRSESAVDGLHSDTASLAIITPVSSRFDLEINFGTSMTDGSDNSLFGGLLVTFFGP